jgi:predicted nucleic acid-binding protein
MTTVFADAFYWIALINPRDNWHTRVLDVSNSLEQRVIVTTDEILTEVLAFYCESGSRMRQRAVQLVDNILNNDKIQVVEQTHESFLTGFALYRDRLDKGYSLTDCISMNTMRQLKITEVLTHDQHFVQEGFVIIKCQLFWPVRVNYFGRFLSSAKDRCLAVCCRKLSA